ncbi:MAG TPA: hypothetical protein DCS87_08840 [Rheinheimera sp.]|nr:hypothetical protein [Rheinheimera sp.]
MQETSTALSCALTLAQAQLLLAIRYAQGDNSGVTEHQLKSRFDGFELAEIKQTLTDLQGLQLVRYQQGLWCWSDAAEQRWTLSGASTTCGLAAQLARLR